MKPDENSHSQGGGSAQPSPLSEPTQQASSQDAAADVIRGKINSLYGDSMVAQPDQPSQSQPEVHSANNPYFREHGDSTDVEQDEWKAYHSAWQNYYQKYYESYYHHQLKSSEPEKRTAHHYFGSNPHHDEETTISQNEPITKEEALLTLRHRLLQRVRNSAEKVRKSRHFVPVISAVVVVLLFAFIQYNTLIFGTVAAYVSPGSIDPQNIVVDPTTDVQVTTEPRLIIPKINVDVPVHYDIGVDNDSQMEAMRTGVAHFAIPGASSHPGEVGNTVIAGHSSNDLFDTGDYKFIFAQLEKLNKGDTIYANYKGIRYTYIITKKEVVQPTNVSALIYETSKPVITLVTCTPLGTSLNRLLVTAEQVSPDPSAAKEAADNTTSTDDAKLPGNAPTLFEKIFGN